LGFLDKSTNKTLYIQKRLKQYGTNESSIIYELVDGEKSYVFNVDNCSLSYNYKYVSNSSRKQITREDIALMTGIKVYVVNNSNKKTLKEVV
jgi:hypothetical protein